MDNPRYLVFKIKYVENILTEEDLEELSRICKIIARSSPPLNAIVIESKWPIYEEVKELLERFIDG